MEKIDFILSGLGGQGILFITKILSLSAIESGYNVLAAETHGMAQRGGSVISHLRIGNAKCSLIKTGTADFIISLEENEAYRNIPFLAKGGKIYTNSRENKPLNNMIVQYFEEQDIDYNAIEASKIVQKLSVPLSLNMAILGFFFSSQNTFLTVNCARTTIEKVSPEKFKQTNLQVFDIFSKNQGLDNTEFHNLQEYPHP